MSFKWATALYKSVLMPSFYGHHMYFQRKAALDRALEKRSGYANSLVGCFFGGVMYLATSPFKPYPVSKSTYELNEDAGLVLALAGVDPKQEMASLAMSELKGKIASKVYVANDRAQIRIQQDQLAELKARQRKEVEESMAAVDAAAAAALESSAA